MAEPAPTRDDVLGMINILKECQEKDYITTEPGYVRSVINVQTDDGVASPGLKSAEYWALLTTQEQDYVNNILAQVS